MSWCKIICICFAHKCFFRHNECISANVENRQAQPITADTDVGVGDYKETFGVTDNTKEDKTIHL